MVDRPEFLALAEVQVLSGGGNVAPCGRARQSSTSHGGDARLAIDGNTDGRFFEGRSVTHTNPNPIPWWEVDLGNALPIEDIVIWNRMDGGLQARLSGFLVSVLDGERRAVWSRRVDEPPNPSLRLHVSGPAPLTLRPAPAAGEDPGGGEGTLQLDPEKGWTVKAGAGARTAAVFETRVPITCDKGTLELTFRPGEQSAGGRFRLSMTRSVPPVCDLPREVEEALKIRPQARTREQKAALEKFYLSVAPALDATRERLRQLEEDLRHQEGRERRN
jgi:hypothetical protein